ncbi:RidA family protein [Mucilaginibacter sp. L3T2-6]|uniref:RidA family protein n=1 Tax=Mucilaginibacter sp. L3T2-6 TaxID=3062491 RepID=UPI0026773949|nr:RidA family protein [Mucilaginibacter sp. L3T2-6]MDO3644575.1 RidA family protein [Mucilaginibacter sp. L3T2-6]MDV6217053.1 RidA family protein [Mucilaginibacter sp. L3T2-6]
MRKILTLISTMILTALCCYAQQKQFINPGALPPLSNGYSQAIKVTGGHTIYIAGQTAVNDKKEIVGKGDFDAQVKRTLDNFRTVLAAADATTADLVKISIYVVDLNPDKLAVLRKYLKDFVTDKPPVSTLIGVKALFNKDVMIEIDGIANTKN